MSEEIGLLRILLEQAPSTCPCISGLNRLSKEEFESTETGYDQKKANKDDLYYDWEPDDPAASPPVFSLDNLLISDSPGTTLDGYSGDGIKELYNNIMDGTENITRENTVLLCDLYTLISHIINTNAQGEQATLQSWNTELCKKATEIWTDNPQLGVEDNDGFYLFTYDGGETSPQVNNIFREKVFDLLGLTDSQKFSEKCVSNVKVNQEAPDEYHNGIRVSGYEVWDGFMVKHACVSPQNTYYSTSLDISQDLPDNFYERVLKFKMRLASPPDLADFEKFERSQGQGTSTNQNVSVSVDNDDIDVDNNEEEGLSTVLTNKNPYEDILFL